MQFRDMVTIATGAEQGIGEVCTKARRLTGQVVSVAGGRGVRQ